ASGQTATVTRGDLVSNITSSGNIETSHEASLNFGSGGKVAKVLVEEGDSVKKGDALASLDTDDLELATTQAEVVVFQAQLALTQAGVASQTADNNLKSTRESQATLELALFNAQIDIKNADYNFNKVSDYYTYTDIRVAEADVAAAKLYLEDALLQLGKYAKTEPGYARWSDVVIHAQSRIKAAEDRLEALIAGRDVDEVAIKKMLLESAQKAEVQAQKNHVDLADDIAIQEAQVASAQQGVEQAQKSLALSQQSQEQARRQLKDATITAPFDGVIAAVNVKEGDRLTSPAATAIHLVDAGNLELIAEVDEIDMPEVRLGQEAIITVDALSGVTFPGKVASIHPVPSVASGVVLYNIKVTFTAADDAGVMIGMSASADVITQKRSNALLVPNRAIKTDKDGSKYVNIIVPGGISKYPVVTGASDTFLTEIISGLKEGELIDMEAK
ncbi:efflux RND transporter periplasmic adaptor subunit, partial [Chloroflexota bacterium]